MLRLSAAYSTACRNNWLNKVSSHLIEEKKPRGYWDKEKCAKEALKFKSKSEFKSNSTAYHAATRNKWIREICKHMAD